MDRFVVFDVETPNARNDRISAIGITVLECGAAVRDFYTLVNPEEPFDDFNIRLTGITPDMTREVPAFPRVWETIRPIMESGTLVAHNAMFDLGVLGKCFQAYGIRWKHSVPYLCTVQAGRRLLPGMSHRLNVLCEHYGIDLNHHQADSDSRACAEILLRYISGGADPARFIRTWTFPPCAEPAYATSAPAPQDALFQDEALLREAGSPRDLLERVYGHTAFRDGQREIIDCLLSGRDALCVMPTGSGKSLCYQIPALALPGTCLVISPLISLMKDQVSALRARGIAAAFLNSSLEGAEYADTAFRAASGGVKILYVAPERLQSPSFSEMCLHMDISLIAVDEAHCISQWGQDFRPSYLKIPEFIRALPARPPVGAFTATATPRVKEDIRRHLELRDPLCVTTGYDRPNLSFSVYRPSDRDAMLLELLRDRFRQSGIVYCATRKSVESITALLQRNGFPATRYHAGLEPEERRKNQEDFLFDRQRVMVATNAFGMGIDKSNVSYVIHYNMPLSLEAYYQEAGRAGRDGGDADCILLYSGQDVMLGRWMIEHKEENPDLTAEEQARIREEDENRLRRMTFYATSTRCLRGDILRYFGEKAPERCDNCSNCVPDCEHQDLTTEAQMILSCVARTGQILSAAPLTDLLRGKVPPDLPGSVNPETLTTFGLMKQESEKQIQAVLRVLLDQGLVDGPAPGEEGPLTLNDQSRAVLFRSQRVTQRRRRVTAGAVPEDDSLFRALQRLRFEISAKEYIAASSLFTDATLRELCRVLPRTRKDLAAVDGMGLFKAARYGDSILPLIERFHPAAGKAKKPRAASEAFSKEEAGSGSDAGLTYRDRVIARGSTDAYQPWTDKEDEQLRDEFRKGLSPAVMAKNHRRTRGAVLSRLKKLELL